MFAHLPRLFPGILDPDPWKRWTAFQAANHPFIAGSTIEKAKADVNEKSPRDENQANRMFGLYWEAPPDPSIYRRRLLNVQKTREKQKAARRGHNRSRTQSPGMHEGLSSVLENSAGKSADDSPVELECNPIGGHRQASNLPHVPFQISSSMQDFGNQQNAQMAGDASILSGPQHFLTGPQSYSEAGPSGVLPGSFNEVDFAYALQRPGVVPMGESMTSSVEMSSGGMPGYSHASFHYSQQHHSHQSHIVGSYGSNALAQPGSQKRQTAAGIVPTTSRSYGEGDVASAPLETSSHRQPPFPPLYASSQGSAIGRAPSADFIAGSVASAIPSVAGNPAPSSLASGIAPAPLADDVTLLNSPNARGNIQNQSFPVYGNAQAYLQQQHAALQQQQLFLQQQQAALALQQEQLRAYGINQVLMTSNTAVPNALGMNPQNFPYGGAAPGMMPTAAVPTGGFYYVAGVDGTPMLVAANPGDMGTGAMGGRQGHISGMVGMVEQLPGMQVVPGMAPVSVGITSGPPSGLRTGMSGMVSSGLHGLSGMIYAAPGMAEGASASMLSMPPQPVVIGDPSSTAGSAYPDLIQRHAYSRQHPPRQQHPI